MEQEFIKSVKVGRVATVKHPGHRGTMHVPYRIGLAEGKATEHENYMEIYDPKTFVAAVATLFEPRTIELTN
jgi:hypothetical protein